MITPAHPATACTSDSTRQSTTACDTNVCNFLLYCIVKQCVCVTRINWNECMSRPLLSNVSCCISLLVWWTVCECLTVSDAEGDSISTAELLITEHAPLFDPIDIAHSEYIIRTGQWLTHTHIRVHVLISGRACRLMQLTDENDYHILLTYLHTEHIPGYFTVSALSKLLTYLYDWYISCQHWWEHEALSMSVIAL